HEVHGSAGRRRIGRRTLVLTRDTPCNPAYTSYVPPDCFFFDEAVHNLSLKRIIEADWCKLRLRDRIRPGLLVLFVGINPGVRSAITGHHFAGHSNRFWKLLSDSRLTPEPLTYEDDHRLPEWGLGITNLIARPSRGINDLRPAEYIEAWKALERKIRRFKPKVVAFVGMTLY